MAMNDQESILSIDSRVIDTFQQVGKFAETEPVKNEAQLYFFGLCFLGCFGHAARHAAS